MIDIKIKNAEFSNADVFQLAQLGLFRVRSSVLTVTDPETKKIVVLRGPELKKEIDRLEKLVNALLEVSR